MVVVSRQAACLSKPALVVLLSATFMAQFDFFVVNVAALSIQHDLDAGDATLELIVGAYAFAYASGLVMGGRLGDIYGHRRIFAIGALAFAGASALCGAAGAPAQLIGARAAQGLGAALMLPQVLALISSGPVAARARGMSWYGAAAGLGAIAGQSLGGFLVSLDLGGLGWRVVFLVAVPIGLSAATLASRLLPAQLTSAADRRSLDAVGAVGLASGLGAALLALTMGRAAGWPWWSWAALIVAAFLLALTSVWERRLDRRGGQPLLSPALLREPSFRYGLSASFIFMAAFASYMFTLALLLQAGLGLSPTEAGLAFVPAGIGFSVAALLAPRLVRRHGTRAVAAAAGLVAAGMFVLMGAATIADHRASLAGIVFATLVISLGNGVVVPNLIGMSLQDVPSSYAGAASGALTTGQQFGSAAGLAILASVYFATSTTSPAVGMAWTAVVCGLLMLAVAALIIKLARLAARSRLVR